MEKVVAAMLQLIRGRANTGKSRMVLGLMKENGPRREQILLVPDQASYAAEVDLCRFLGDEASRYAQVLTFSRLTRRVLAETGGLETVSLDGGGKLLMMERALLDVSSHLTVYRRPSQKAGFLQEFIDLMDELQRYQVTMEQLEEQADRAEGNTKLKLRDIALLYGAYRARLCRDGVNLSDDMDKLIAKLAESRYIDGKDVYLDGFAHFTAQEMAVLDILLRRAHSVTVALLGEVGSRQEIFQAGNRAYDALRELAAGCGSPVVPLAPPEREGTPDALRHLEEQFFGDGAVFPGECPEIQLYQGENLYTEVEAVAAAIRTKVAKEGCRFRDFGVVVRRMADYEGAVENVFERYGVPVYLSRRSNLSDKPMVALVLSALEAVTGGFEYEDMFRFLKTGLAGVSDRQCDLLENYALKWDLRGNAWIREEPWKGNPEGYGAELTPEREFQLQEVNRCRELVRPQLAALKAGLQSAGTARGKMEALYQFLEDIHLPRRLKERSDRMTEAGELQLAEEYRQLWEILCHIMDQFVEILGDAPLGNVEFLHLMKLMVNQYSVGTIPAALDQVAFSELTLNDRHSVKWLYIMGATDDAMPAVDRGGSILTEDERELLLQGGLRLAPHGMEKLGMELTHLYAALSKPTEGLWISYPAAGAAGAEQRPSFLFPRIQSLFHKVSVTREGAGKEFHLTAPIPALEAAGDFRSGKLWQYFEAREVWQEALRGMERGAAMTRGRLSPAAVRTLYGDEVRMSASRIDKIKSCHFAYFMQYGLRARRRQSAAFDAIQVGNLLHYVLEKVTADATAAGGFADTRPEELRVLTDRYMDEYLQEAVGDLQERSARLRYLLRRLRQSVRAVVDNVGEELRSSDFAPMRFEMKFGGEGAELPAISVTRGDTRLQVTGYVDRVDGWLRDNKLYLRVVDYKTGKKSFDLADIVHGLGLQMLLYLFTLEKEGRPLFGHDVVGAGVLYLPARDELLSGKRGMSDGELKSAMEKTLRRSGLLLGDREVLEAMEHGATESPRFLPLAVNKDGDITKGVATAAQLGSLSRYVDRVLEEIAREIGEGNIDADPYTRSEQDSACTYCEFAAACHFADGERGDHAQPIRSVTPEEFWQAVEEKEEEETRWQ